MKLFKPTMIRSVGQLFFSTTVIQQWNELPYEVVLEKTIISFKHLFDWQWTETGHGHCQRPLAYILTNFVILLSI